MRGRYSGDGDKLVRESDPIKVSTGGVIGRRQALHARIEDSLVVEGHENDKDMEEDQMSKRDHGFATRL